MCVGVAYMWRPEEVGIFLCVCWGGNMCVRDMWLTCRDQRTVVIFLCGCGYMCGRDIHVGVAYK